MKFFASFARKCLSASHFGVSEDVTPMVSNINKPTKSTFTNHNGTNLY